MKKMILMLCVVSALVGCGSGSSINCETPEVQQTELQILGQLDPRDITSPPMSESAQLQVESTTQFTDKQTGVITCNVQYSYFHSGEKKREIFFRTMVFELKVADDHEHFYVSLAQE